ncbi:GNAT family N-acetyltransferase [Acidimangrovimonas sediminis]|uniref:GNAT family N-acetyltransferase n=1 Tax=Acidimangrovimonas sediminis TaxID=2056283 RepID=UPI000C7FCB09|nr:GNAT family N-acetyltransferase [Acidimangrovimonas sediminis]
MTDSLLLRPATPADARGMSAILVPILAGWHSSRNGDPATVEAHYIAHPDRIACTLAEAEGRILGFQSLKLARPGNAYGVTPGWGIIGTYVAPDAGRGGIGRGLFAETARAARGAGLPWIDATIGAGNPAGQAYYAAMGFADYAGGSATAVCKRYRVA